MRRFQITCLTAFTLANILTPGKMADAYPGGCWTTSQEYGCCLMYPQLNQTVPCYGATCLPAYTHNEMTRHLVNVVSGWRLSSMEHTDPDPRCWIQVALCDETAPTPTCIVSPWVEKKTCPSYEAKEGLTNCYIEQDI